VLTRSRTALTAAVLVLAALGVGWLTSPSDLPNGASKAPTAPERHVVRANAPIGRSGAFSRVRTAPSRVGVAPAEGVHRTIRDARRTIDLGVRRLVTELHVDEADATALDGMRIDALSELTVLAEQLRTGEIDDDAASAEVERVRTSLSDRAASLLGAERTDAVRSLLGPSTP
jgi:hypothetical protein